eukprot:gene27680-7322_t
MFSYTGIRASLDNLTAITTNTFFSPTSHAVVYTNADAVSSDAGSAEGRDGGEKFEFQAEVGRLMDIIIHSLYSNKDIFLRELISNASDALDKLRFLALTDKTILGEGEAANLEIKISLDKEKNILSIQDRGIGMTKDDLVKNLGTIAKSGTSSFLEAMQKGGDMNLIGQFGVGFYSVYLVADYVEVVTKHNDDKQYIWASSADGGFSIEEDTENGDIGRGTIVKLHLKEEAQEYADDSKLRELVSTYSEFINFPIFLLSEKEVDVPIEEEADADESAETKDENEYEDDVEDDEDAEEEDTPTRKEKRMEWDLLNDNKAIWLRRPTDVTDVEYQKFYKAVSKDYSDALDWSHFKAEGDVEFKSVLFIPKTAPFDFYDKYYEKGGKHALKLYVRRVFISDTMEELIPRYLGFIRGVVDSDTLPLSVSREMLQSHAALKTIKKKLVRKVLDVIKKMADDEVKCRELDNAEGSEDGEEEEKRPSEEQCGKYATFWESFGRAMKLGVIEDTTNRNRLAKLLRFPSSKSEDKLTTLEEYVSRMKDGQKEIYFLAGSSKAEIEQSPFLEKLLLKGYEVIYFTDVLDEYVMQHMIDYDDKKFANAAKEDLKMSDKDEKEKKKDKQLKDEFKDLTKWWKSQLSASEVTSVKVSTRLSTTPCVVVASKYGQSANMERIQKAQAFSDPTRAAMMGGGKVFEINPRHAMMKAMKAKFDANPDDESTQEVARVLYETALLESGFTPSDPKSFSKRVYGIIKGVIGMEDAIDKVDEDTPEEEVEAEAEEGADPMEGINMEGMETFDLDSMNLESMKTADHDEL